MLDAVSIGCGRTACFSSVGFVLPLELRFQALRKPMDLRCDKIRRPECLANRTQTLTIFIPGRLIAANPPF